MSEINKFKERLKANLCPFCAQKLTYYGGALSYESLKCNTCKINIDNDGLTFD